MDVSIIVINYQSSSYTLQCVQSILKNSVSALSFEIIVIDNASDESDFEKLNALEKYSQIKLFRSKQNLGFAGGNMLGVQFAAPNVKYFYFLNNDCVLLNDNLKILFDFAEKNTEIAVLTGQMFDSEQKFHPSFGYFPSLKVKLFGHSICRFFEPQKFLDTKKVYSQPIEVQRVTGSAMFIRSEFFQKIGGFDTHYFLYCEEEDICLQSQKLGYKNVVVPDAKFIHFGGKSTKRNFEIEKEFYISLFYFFRKYYSFFEILMLKMLYFFKNFRKFYKDKMFLRLAFFILQNSPMRRSLRFKQKIK